MPWSTWSWPSGNQTLYNVHVYMFVWKLKKRNRMNLAFTEYLQLAFWLVGNRSLARLFGWNLQGMSGSSFIYFLKKEKLFWRHCCLLCKHLQLVVPALNAVATGERGSATCITSNGSMNWSKIKRKSGRGGDKHQKERKQVQGDAATDLVCFCDSCLAMRFFFSPLAVAWPFLVDFALSHAKA
jgi:hypothetical protein